MPIKPTDQEEEYFAKQEFERRKRMLAEQESRSGEDERLRALATAGGRCPKDGAKLVAVPYRGVEIDKCSRCQGIWLDVGELARVTASDERGFLGSLGRIFGG